MPQVRNVSGQARMVPALGAVVPPDGVVDVDDVAPYVCQSSTWSEVTAAPPVPPTPDQGTSTEES